MAINFTEVQQKLDRVLNNAGEIVRNLWKLHFDPTPQDITTSVYDEFGNLQTVSIPNVAKWRNTIWADAQSAMYKIFYVDARNGSDTTGDGSANAPFKTIAKAVNSLPHGGLGIIYLANNAAHEINNPPFHIKNKSLEIRTWDVTGTGANAVVRKVPGQWTGILVEYGGFIEIVNVDLDLTADTSDGNSYHLFFVYSGIGVIKLGRYTPGAVDVLTCKLGAKLVEVQNAFCYLHCHNVTFQVPPNTTTAKHVINSYGYGEFIEHYHSCTFPTANNTGQAADSLVVLSSGGAVHSINIGASYV